MLAKKCGLYIIVFCLLVSVGCAKVEGYKEFYIEEFEDFFNLKSIEDRTDYIKSGKLNFSQEYEVVFVPYLKEVNHTECAILLSVLSTDENKSVEINKISLTDMDGNVISCVEKYGGIEILSEWREQMITINTFKTDDKWCYDGNELILSICATVNDGNKTVQSELSYSVVVREYQGPVLQV